MVFSSITFLFYYLPFCIALYFLTKYKNLALLLTSLFFYAWGEAEYVVILVCMSIINYFLGLIISRKSTNSKISISFGLVINLSFLLFFKYATFIIDSINAITILFGIKHISVSNIHLPLGISFFTFQAMSYLIDVYRNRTLAEKNPMNVILYISMFPQLIAGPIVRFHSIANELNNRRETIELFTDGVKYFVIGLAQKVLIANTVALTVDKIFATPADMLNTTICWLAAICYTLQIYFDFLGYSNMAIGLGLFFGFHFPINFNFPYQSRSITEFWKRWHITLSSWFRDYLYIPLGGNRKGPARTYLNLLCVFVLCGLWHGANWTFVIWGLYHGFFMIIERVGFKNIIEKAATPIRHFYLLFVVITGWVIFRADTFAYAVDFTIILLGIKSGNVLAHPIGEFLQIDVIIAVFAGIVCSFPTLEYLKKHIKKFILHTFEDQFITSKLLNEVAIIVALCALMLTSAMQLASGTYNPFIYFRF